MTKYQNHVYHLDLHMSLIEMQRRRSLDLGRRSSDLGKRPIDLSRRRRSMSYDPRGDLGSGMSRAGSVDRFSCYSGFGGGSGNIQDASIPPQFRLPLFDQTHAAGSRLVLSVQGQYIYFGLKGCSDMVSSNYGSSKEYI